jgi:hypothetical protein
MRHALLLCVLIAACSDAPAGPPMDGGTASEPADPEPTGPVSQWISPGGGSVSAVTAEGARVTLTFPAGAVTDGTEVTLRPLVTPSDLWMQIALEPAGMVFRKPLDITVSLPREVTPQDGSLMLRPHSGPVPLAAAEGSTERTLRTAELTFFGFPPPADEASEPDATAVPSTGVVRVAGASTPAGSSGAEGGSNTLAAGAMTCQETVALGRIALDVALASGGFEDAVHAALALGRVLTLQACAAQASALIEEAVSVSCAGLVDVLAEIDQTPIDRYGQFEDEATRVLGWVGLLQKTGADCSADWLGGLEKKSDDFIRFAVERSEALRVPDFGAFIDLRDDARRILGVMTRAYIFGLENAWTAIEEGALLPVLDRARAVGFEVCRSGVWHFPLSRLTTTGFFSGRDIIGVPEPRPGPVWPPPSDFARFTDDEIFEDIQYCGTNLTIESFVASGGSLASQRAGTSGVPGRFVSDLTLEVPTRGTLRLGGELQGITCWNDVPADHEVVVELDGRRVHALTRSETSGYIGGEPIELEIAAIAEEASIVPKEGSPASLRLVRKRDQCLELLWGPEEFELFSATLQWRNPTLEVDVRLSDDPVPGTDVEAEVRVTVVDQHGEAGYFDDVDVQLEVEGGTALHPAGTTDAEGFFRTAIHIPDDGASGGVASLTVRARATSFEGVTATGMVTTGAVCALPAELPEGQPDWGLPVIRDASTVEESETGIARVDVSGTTFDRIAAEATSTSTVDAREWSPAAHPDLQVIDYVKVIPDRGWADGEQLFLRVRYVGRAEAVTEGTDDRAEIRAMSRVEALASHGEQVTSDMNEVESMTFSPSLGWQGWQDIQQRVTGYARTRGGRRSARASVEYSIAFEGVVDWSGQPVAATICTASGAGY